nr:GTPase HflX [Clostridia bacterium]
MEPDNNRERFISFAVAQDDETADASLDELAELADTAGGEIVARMIQHLPHPDPVTYLGKGKVQELREMMDALEADAVICD